jgi:hypothetical protein
MLGLVVFLCMDTTHELPQVNLAEKWTKLKAWSFQLNKKANNRKLCQSIMDKLYAVGQNLGRVINFRYVHLFAKSRSFSRAKLLSLKWKSQPKTLLDFPLPDFIYFYNGFENLVFH